MLDRTRRRHLGRWWYVVAAVPVVFQGAFLFHFSYNVPFWDDWSVVPLVISTYTGHLSLTSLWAQHNENRMFIAYVIYIVIARVSAFNTVAIMTAGQLCLLASALVIAKQLRVWSRASWLLPIISFVLFSPVQIEDTLWAFQIAWYLVLVCLAGVAYLLSSERRGHQWIAVALGLIGTVTSMQGLLIWFAAVPLLRTRSVRDRWTWGLMTVMAYIIYFWGFQFGDTGGPPLTFAVHHLVLALKYFFVLMGNTILPATSSPGGYAATGLVGIVLFGLYILAIVRWAKTGTDNIESRPLTAAVVLIAFGLAFDILTTIGRSGFGIMQATSSRYALYNLVAIAGLLGAFRHTFTGRRVRLPESLVGGMLAVLLIFLVVLGTRTSVSAGQSNLSQRTSAAQVLVNYEVAPKALITSSIDPLPGFRVQAHVLERYRLSAFAERGITEKWRSYGLVPLGTTLVSLPVPTQFRQALQRRGLDGAWRTLEWVYDSRPDLQKAFPESQSGYLIQLLHWANSWGIGKDGAHVYLRGYAGQLRELLTLAKNA